MCTKSYMRHQHQQCHEPCPRGDIHGQLLNFLKVKNADIWEFKGLSVWGWCLSIQTEFHLTQI